ncbi:hypothetical protein BS640_18735 [Rouxiella badensis]|uniref:Uncharacterized protein n=1 Tax=Rouxiella badensis TaxID=1646377 RepID=A0A1X0WAZ2_9GAMM|nr:hypothetical protein BS640_18735 [Rouxiella badensis]
MAENHAGYKPVITVIHDSGLLDDDWCRCDHGRRTCRCGPLLELVNNLTLLRQGLLLRLNYGGLAWRVVVATN